jgi:hypothetical protein
MTWRHFTLLSGATAVAIFGLAQRASTPVRRWTAAPAQAREAERVRIEQQIVRIPVTTPSPPARRRTSGDVDSRPLRRGVAWRTVSGPASKQPARKAEPAPEAGLFSRTVKIILGDGRHKPQPFPKAEG